MKAWKSDCAFFDLEKDETNEFQTIVGGKNDHNQIQQAGQLVHKTLPAISDRLKNTIQDVGNDATRLWEHAEYTGQVDEHEKYVDDVAGIFVYTQQEACKLAGREYLHPLEFESFQTIATFRLNTAGNDNKTSLDPAKGFEQQERFKCNQRKIEDKDHNRQSNKGIDVRPAPHEESRDIWIAVQGFPRPPHGKEYDQCPKYLSNAKVDRL